MPDTCSGTVSAMQRRETRVRLTVYTDFSLRVLMFLSVKGNGLAAIAEIAKAYGISKNHLMKVAHQLGLAGYVETVRGKGGGLRLARRPQGVVLGDVVRYTEPDMVLVPCFDPGGVSCAIFQSCALRFPRLWTRSIQRSTGTVATLRRSPGAPVHHIMSEKRTASGIGIAVRLIGNRRSNCCEIPTGRTYGDTLKQAHSCTEHPASGRLCTDGLCRRGCAGGCRQPSRWLRPDRRRIR